MKKYLASLAGVVILMLTTGCTFMVKTPVVADYQRLNLLNQSTTRTDVEKMLGTPQGMGVHIVNGKTYDLTFYYGISGTISMFGASNVDFGMALISYEGDKLVNLLYFTAMSKDDITFGQDIPIKRLAEKMIVGETNIRVVYEIMGPPRYRGRLIHENNNAIHNIVAWDSSRTQNNSAIKEKLLILGIDDREIIQDINWVSSLPEEIQALGETSEQHRQQISKIASAGYFLVPQLQSISTTTKLDAIQVDAILKDKPANVKEISDIIGKPTALGIRSFKNNPPLILSSWSHYKAVMMGYEAAIIVGVSEEAKVRREQAPTYMVMDFIQSRLIVGHDSNGEIKEILWFKPLK
jgi:hypothetical protein